MDLSAPHRLLTAAALVAAPLTVAAPFHQPEAHADPAGYCVSATPRLDAMREMLAYVDSGARIEEDLSWAGMSANASAQNDAIAEAFYASDYTGPDALGAWLARQLDTTTLDDGTPSRYCGPDAVVVGVPAAEEDAATERLVAQGFHGCPGDREERIFAPVGAVHEALAYARSLRA